MKGTHVMNIKKKNEEAKSTNNLHVVLFQRHEDIMSTFLHWQARVAIS